MALKFKCGNCGEYIITKFLKVGEVAKCHNCGAETKVPEDAIETAEEPKYGISKVTEPETDARIKGKVRPFWKVLLLTIITFGIYLWVYPFKTVREMENEFSFEAQEIKPGKVRSILIAYLLVILSLGILSVVVFASLKLQNYSSPTSGFYAWALITQIIDTILFVAFFLSFIKLIEACQKKRGIAPLSKSMFWILIAIEIVFSFAFVGRTAIASPVLLGIVAGVVELILLYLTVKEVNRIWEGSRKVKTS